MISKQAHLQLWICIGAVFVLAVFLASRELWRRLIIENGKTVATYVLTDHPTVEVRMYGLLQGHTFQVFTDTKGSRAEIFSDLWTLPPNGGNSVPADSVFYKQMRATTSGGGMSHEVYWTQDGTKCAIALRSHLIAAFDIRSGAKIQYTGEQYENFHPRILSFLSR
jgi:hypothetical protein